jgi:hypothetical protein
MRIVERLLCEPTNFRSKKKENKKENVVRVSWHYLKPLIASKAPFLEVAAQAAIRRWYACSVDSRCCLRVSRKWAYRHNLHFLQYASGRFLRRLLSVFPNMLWRTVVPAAFARRQ